MSEDLVNVRGLTTYYKTRLKEEVCSVDDVSLTMKKGEVLGVAGESGCGKSTLSLSIMGFYYPPLYYRAGEIILDGRDIMQVKKADMGKVLGAEIAYIPQAAMNALNPTRKIIKFIEDVILSKKPKETKEGIRKYAEERFDRLNLPKRVLDSYPNELSGGMKQRTVIAISTILNPKVLIADEPTSALDVSSQKIVIKLMRQLLAEGFVQTMMFITHELPLLRHVASEVLIMYAGQIVERGDTEDVIFHPYHPYTRALMGSIIVPEEGMKDVKLSAIPGAPPNLKERMTGCRFAPRCEFVTDECRAADVDEMLSDGRCYRCIFQHDHLKELYAQSDAARN